MLRKLSQLPINQKVSLVWLISGTFLLIYAGLGLWGLNIPGVEQLLLSVEKAEGMYFYLITFLVTFLEGLYIVGNFIPGSTLMILIAVVSISFGPGPLFFTLFCMWLGWSLAGAINIYVSRRLITMPPQSNLKATDNIFLTWYPAFRANHEVAEVIAGANPLSVFISSLRVKFYVCIAMAVYCFALQLLIDISEINNEEGFVLVASVSLISIGIGWYKWRKI